MSAQLDFNTTDEGESAFNFKTWIENNKLNDIRNLFVKHGATNKLALTTTSSQFKSLLVDPELLQQPHVLPLIMDALNKIPDHDSDTLTTKNNHHSYIIVSHEEHTAMDNMQKHIDCIDKMGSQLFALQAAYIQNRANMNDTKASQMKAIEIKIKECFAKIHNANLNRQQQLLQQLKNKNIQDDDNKEQNILKDLIEKVNAEKEYISSALNECQDMIKSSNASRSNIRKVNVSEIGTQMVDRFNAIQNDINETTEHVEKIMRDENKVMTFAFVFKDETLNNILRKMDNLGMIIDGEYDESKHNDDIDYKKKIESLQKALDNEICKGKELERKCSEKNDDFDDLLRLCKSCNRKYYDDLNKKGECAHIGKWHETYSDCNKMRCAIGLGKNIGAQHWSCCFSLESDGMVCKKSAKHEPYDM